MFKNPHALVEGIAISALAVGATYAFIFIRGEYWEVADVLDAAVAEAYDAGYLGENILGSGCRVELVVHRGAGAYICGEETALLDSLEGKRGNPRLKPPVPRDPGPLRRSDADQQRRDADERAAHRQQGLRVVQERWAPSSPPAPRSSPSRAASQRPGNYEIELGIPSREIIYDLAGGPAEGREVKVWFPGGSSAPVLTGDDLDLPYSFEAMAEAGSMLGSGAIIVGDDTVSVPAAGAQDRALLPPRVLRQVHAVPRGHQLDGEDARARRPRRGDADGPRHHLLGPGEHHRQLPLRPRRRDGDAGRLDGQEVPRRVRAGDRRSARRRPRTDRRRRSRRAAAGPGSDGLVPNGKEITLVVDGVEVPATEGAMLVDAAKGGDVEIPVFCYEPKLGGPVGACRMCLVEVEGIPKLQTACSTPVRDGMVVYTQTDRVQEAQNAVVEFLLVNHPLDCPVCDKGGECPLQDISMGWGAGKSRVTDPKRHFQKPVPLSPLVRIDRERCILCYRCVRFSSGGRRGRAAPAPRARVAVRTSAPSTTAPTSPPSTATSSSSAPSAP